MSVDRRTRIGSAAINSDTMNSIPTGVISRCRSGTASASRNDSAGSVSSMGDVNVVASTVVAAPARIVYELIADYRTGHPSILPPEYFEDLQVEEGGRGAGTRIRFTMKSFGTRRVSTSIVTEPEPGRLLVETDVITGITTKFI